MPKVDHHVWEDLAGLCVEDLDVEEEVYAGLGLADVRAD
jgi:hypothetical protein